MHRNMPGRGQLLQALQNREPGVVGQAHVQQDRIGYELRRQVEAFIGGVSHQAVITQLMGQVIKDLRKPYFVFDHRMQRRLNGPFSRSSAKEGISMEGGAAITGLTNRGAGVGNGDATTAAGSTPYSSWACSTYCSGNTRVKILPWPGALVTEIEPPSNLARSREMDSPNPVPP